MPITIEENPSRKKIIMLLKKAEHLTVAQMSKEMGITSMAVRQHLMSLEKRGLIGYSTRKYGIGRPVFLYSLTEKAIDYFPKAYGDLAKDVLATIERLDGRKKVALIFKERKNSILASLKASIGSEGSLEQRVRALADIMEERGNMVELTMQEGTMDLKIYNCLLHSLIADYPEACQFELEMLNELLATDVKRTECQRDGASYCQYVVNVQ